MDDVVNPDDQRSIIIEAIRGEMEERATHVGRRRSLKDYREMFVNRHALFRMLRADDLPLNVRLRARLSWWMGFLNPFAKFHVVQGSDLKEILNLSSDGYCCAMMRRSIEGCGREDHGGERCPIQTVVLADGKDPAFEITGINFQFQYCMWCGTQLQTDEAMQEFSRRSAERARQTAANALNVGPNPTDEELIIAARKEAEADGCTCGDGLMVSLDHQARQVLVGHEIGCPAL